LTSEPEDAASSRPVREGWASALERLSSYREPSSRNPKTSHPRFLVWKRGARAPFRLLSTRAPRQAVLRASSRLAPRDFHHEVSRLQGAQDARCVQSTSATQTICVYPVPRRVPGSSCSFRCLDVPRSLRLRATRPGDRTFHDVRLASADPHRTRTSYRVPSWRSPEGRAWASYTHGARCDRTSDAPVASPSSTSRSPTFVDEARSLRGCPDLRAGWRREGAAKVRIPVTSRKVTLHVDPEHLPSSGTLRRIRWPLQPRSRDDSAAFATMPPLDGVLTPSRALAGLRPFPVRDRLPNTPSHDALSEAFAPKNAPARPPFT
jgi:hypothetical protein